MVATGKADRLEEVLPQMLDSHWPVAVVDRVGAFLGIVSRERNLGPAVLFARLSQGAR